MDALQYKSSEPPDVNINTGAQSINTDHLNHGG